MAFDEHEPRMGAFDAVMWGIEEDPVLRSVIVVMLIVDGVPDRARFEERVERLTREVPQLRQHVMGNPLSLVPPRWETDQSFDLTYHMRWIALPRSDASMRGALSIAERMAEQDFDRSRPLWELTTVTGIRAKGSRGTQSAIILKIHHAITDGVGGMMLAATLFDLGPDGRDDLGPMPELPSTTILDPLRRLVDGVTYETEIAGSSVKGLVDTASSVARSALANPLATVASARDYVSSASRLLAPASTPLSPTMTGRSLSVHFDVIETPLSRLKDASKAADGTLNDAFMAVVATSMRLYHEETGGAVPPAVRVNMPVNLRTSADHAVGGNAWIPARFPLPITTRDPVALIKELHPILLRARTEPALPISSQVFRVLSTLPRAVTTLAAGGLMKGTDVAATNVPGPPFPVYVAGSKVRVLVPFAPKGGAAVNIALMSYDGRAELGINVDTAAVRQPELFVECVRRALADVLSISS